MNPRRWRPGKVGDVLRGKVLRTVTKFELFDTLPVLGAKTVYHPEPNWKIAPDVVVAPDDGSDPVLVKGVRFLDRDPKPGDMAHVEVAGDDPLILIGAFVASVPTDVEPNEGKTRSHGG